MHQTFYIDIDEEITSIVDRLRKAKAKEVVIVVPKRALLIQSIVNLKLLKKEADELKVGIMIVTQDKVGKMAVEKAGILVQEKLDSSLEDDVVFEGETDMEQEVAEELAEDLGRRKMMPRGQTRKIGSENYFEKTKNVPEEKTIRVKEGNHKKEESFEKLINRELVSGVDEDNLKKNKKILKKMRGKKSVPMDMIAGKMDERENEDEFVEEEKTDKFSSKIEAFYNGNGGEKREIHQSFERPMPKRRKSSGFWRILLLIFFSLIILGSGLFIAYYYLTKASVNIYASLKTENIDLEISGDGNISETNLEAGTVPIKVISMEEELNKGFDSSGKKSVSNQKAHGTLTIYNEFSASAQTLVATTRFQAPDGKIFRLTKTTVVPGTTSVSGETKPGAIEAEVTADESGEAYNIEPSTFSIPGFKDSGNEKFTKFYAKSFKKMTGGGSNSQEAKIITEADINSAKTKVLEDLKGVIIQKVKDSTSNEYVVPDGAIEIKEAEYKVSNSVGEMTNDFTITVKAKGDAFLIKNQDIKTLISREVSKKKPGMAVDANSITFQFQKVEPDFGKKTLNLKVQVPFKAISNIDVDNLRRGMLGKNEEELTAYLGTFPEIERFSVEYRPFFVPKKIPIRESQVEIKTLDSQ